VTLSPGVRKLALAAHVVSSVGWLGAVVAFLGIAVVGLASEDPDTVRGAYLVLEPAARLVLVPFAFASLLTGLVQAFGTPWGLFRHYWVVFKLLINVFATVVLLLYLQTFSAMADLAADTRADLDAVRNVSPLLHAAIAAVLLAIATILAVLKPRGLTPYGQRKQRARAATGRDEGRTRRPSSRFLQR
jgi:hypothetical protein